MSKKLISLLLAICMLFCLSACGTTETSSNPTNKPSESQTDTVKDNDENTLGEENSQESFNTEETNENDTTQTQTQTNQSKPTSTTNQPTHTHSYSDATCTSPKKCSCGATNGTTLGHSYSDANCTTPQKCTRCGITAGTALGHQFSSATCTSPQICSRCGTTSGNALGHSYSDANCNSPKTCARCAQTEGSALGHNYVNNKCSRCGKVDPDSLPVGLEKLTVIDSSNDWSAGYYFINNSVTDSFGNTYNKWHKYTYYSSGVTYATHNLNGKYSIFSGSLIATPDTKSNKSYTFKIYVDDVLKFSKTGYTKTTGKIDFSVDVKGCQKLTIETVSEQVEMTTSCLGIVNAQLTK